MILGLSGKIGSGKDYLASHRFSKEHKNVLILAFADFLKIEYGVQNNVSYERLFVNKDAKSRIGLQETSGYYKKKYGNDYYINALDLFIKIHKQRNNINCFIITDVRFPNEYNYIKKMGGKVYRIEAKDRTLIKLRKETNNDQEKINKIMNHESETMLDDYKFDKIIDNSIRELTSYTSSE